MKNNATMSLNMLIFQISNHNLTREKQIILVIPNKGKEAWHYLAVKTLLVRLKHRGDFYCLNYLHYFRTENNLKSHEKVCENNDLWNCNAFRKG